jgi:hypothetical protein
VKLPSMPCEIFRLSKDTYTTGLHKHVFQLITQILC